MRAHRDQSLEAGGQGPTAGVGGSVDLGGRRWPARILGPLHIRKKLLLLHTVFSLMLAGALLIAIRPALVEVIRQAESDKAQAVLRTLLASGARTAEAVAAAPSVGDDVVTLRTGTGAELGIDARTVVRAKQGEGDPVVAMVTPDGAMSVALLSGASPSEAHEAGRERLISATVRIPASRRAVVRLYVFITLALLAVYALIVIALEVMVLPQQVYRPIRRMLDADDAARTGDRAREMIDPREIGADELGEIMRSRNATIAALRRKESELALALERAEQLAGDLAKKNHLLEAARRNLADADRLASLGLMSAGIAHELNTPLTVIRGLADRLALSPAPTLSADEARLMQRVVGRLERLGESLLDFARVREPLRTRVELRPMIDEALTLVRLDRVRAGVELVNACPAGLVLDCDADRIVQVLVNVARNAVDALVAPGTTDRAGATGPVSERRKMVQIEASTQERDGRRWVAVIVWDTGPGIAPGVLASLFEPFASTKLDAKGTGLGLAVARGIVEEHGGVIVGRNRTGQGGAEFEILLPQDAGSNGQRSAERSG